MCACVYMCIPACVDMHIFWVYMCIYVSLHVCMHVHLFACLYMHIARVCMSACVCVYTCVCMCVYNFKKIYLRIPLFYYIPFALLSQFHFLMKFFDFYDTFTE